MNDNDNKVSTTYRGFQLTTSSNGEAYSTLAAINGKTVFGTFSHLDDLSSVEKMQQKIDRHLSTNKS